MLDQMRKISALDHCIRVGKSKKNEDEKEISFYQIKAPF